jgi:DNA polymerase alpha subunit A
VQSSIGRLRRSQLPRVTAGSNGQETFVGVLAAGRLVCDTYLSAREVLRETTYTLSNLARTQLGTDRREVDPLEVPRFFGESASVLGLCRHTENDAHLAMQLMFKLQVP